MRVEQLINNNGNPANNQFIINNNGKEIFQSYSTIIAEVKKGVITLDSYALSYSRTTSKHLYIFLGMDRKEIEQGLKDKTIKSKNLNK